MAGHDVVVLTETIESNIGTMSRITEVVVDGVSLDFPDDVDVTIAARAEHHGLLTVTIPILISRISFEPTQPTEAVDEVRSELVGVVLSEGEPD